MTKSVNILDGWPKLGKLSTLKQSRSALGMEVRVLQYQVVHVRKVTRLKMGMK